MPSTLTSWNATCQQCAAGDDNAITQDGGVSHHSLLASSGASVPSRSIVCNGHRRLCDAVALTPPPSAHSAMLAHGEGGKRQLWFDAVKRNSEKSNGGGRTFISRLISSL